MKHEEQAIADSLAKDILSAKNGITKDFIKKRGQE